MKLELKLSNKWLEATWIQSEIRVNQDNGDEKEITQQVHCESFSGHPEHIAMLRAKALEYGTELDEAIVKELADSYEAPTQAELDATEVANKISEAKAYLASSDFKMTVDYYATLTLEQQAELTTKRAEARAYLKGQGL